MNATRVTQSLVLAALLPLFACSGSGDPVMPPGLLPTSTNYVFATITVLDADSNCQPNCEFIDCGDLTPVVAGTTYRVAATDAAAGIVGGTVSASPTISISATDTGRKTGVAIEFQVSNLTSSPPTTTVDSDMDGANGVFANVDLQCSRVNASGLQESRFPVLSESDFEYPAGWANEVQLTTLPVVGGAIQVAVPNAVGGFTPEGIIEGTFRFVGRGRQEAATQPIFAIVAVEGCFRVNLPLAESRAPVTQGPISGGC
jgi:hypothetical protein